MVSHCSVEAESFSAEHSKYEQFCQPKLAELLRILKLDKSFIKAKAASLFYVEANEQVEVIDAIGGYGSVYFGHNHPELKALAMQMLNDDVAVHAQLSQRYQAGVLGQRLQDEMLTLTGDSYTIKQANSGAEAVELAIKHAELARICRLEKATIQLEVTNKAAIDRLLTHDISFNVQSKQLLNDRLDLNIEDDFPDARVLSAIQEYNCSQREKAPALVALKNAFHGKTTGSLQTTYNKDFRLPFKKLGIHTHFVDAQANEFEFAQQLNKVFEQAIIEQMALRIEAGELHVEIQTFSTIVACIIELIQGEGGIVPIAKTAVKHLQESCQRNKVPLVFDEIQTGMGRTGSFLCSQHYQMYADYYTLGKSLGGGVAKIGAVMIKSALYEDEFDLLHSSTFTEDDWTSALALKSVEMVCQKEHPINKNGQARSEQLLKGLHALQQQYPDLINDVRGMGLMLAIEFSDDYFTGTLFRDLSDQKKLGYVMAAYLLNVHGIRVAPTLSRANTLRIEPPAVITQKQCEAILSALESLCHILACQNLYHLTRFLLGNRVLIPKEKQSDIVKDYRHHQNSLDVIATDRKVGFIAHVSVPSNYHHWSVGLEPSLTEYDDQEIYDLAKLMAPVMSPALHLRRLVTSSMGDTVELNIIGVHYNAHHIKEEILAGRRVKMRDLIQDAVNEAIDLGCSVVGLGGYTSIATVNGEKLDIVDDTVITTGNALTTAMGIKAMQEVADEQSVSMSGATLAAVGAAGNICSIYCELMAEQVANLILVGKKFHRRLLEILAKRIYQQAFDVIAASKSSSIKNNSQLTGIAKTLVDTMPQDALSEMDSKLAGEAIFDWFEQHKHNADVNLPIMLCENLDDLPKAHFVVSASSDPNPIIFSDMLAPNAIVCDIAVPQDVSRAVKRERPDVTVIEGGLVEFSCAKDFNIPGMPLENGLAFACMAETALLGLGDIKSHYSFGAISKNQVVKIAQLADVYGLRLARPKLENDISY